jgi:hypothetical protein
MTATRWHHVGVWGDGGIAPFTFNVGTLDENEWSASRPNHFTLGERVPGTQWIVGWMRFRGPLKVLENAEVPRPCRVSNCKSSVVRSSPCHWTDWATPLPEEGIYNDPVSTSVWRRTKHFWSMEETAYVTHICSWEDSMDIGGAEIAQAYVDWVYLVWLYTVRMVGVLWTRYLNLRILHKINLSGSCRLTNDFLFILLTKLPFLLLYYLLSGKGIVLFHCY